MTYLSLLSGLLAVWAAKELQSWSLAGAFLALCSLSDLVDGKFARLFNRAPDQKEFGVQLDSLTDALTFGLVPVIALALLLPPLPVAATMTWWAVAFFYSLSVITRLGFYNLRHQERSDFVGLPSTVSGLIWSSVFLVEPSALLSVAILVTCGTAMVSDIPIRRPGGLGLATLGGWAALLIFLHGTELTL
jgi:CDP-diacylglycerol--serine O-phosphatidyltransferase